MSTNFNRRRFIQTSALAGAGLALGTLGVKSSAIAMAAEPAVALEGGAPYATNLGWQLGCQLYSFHKGTYTEAIAKNASLGLTVCEAFPGQAFSPENPDLKIGPGMSAEERQMMAKVAADAGVKIMAFGVCGLGNSPEEAKVTFDFAKDLGIQILTSEPPKENLKWLDKMANEYEINVAIHNHPKPSPYWDYKTVLSACEGLSPRVGACADLGHWMRSSICPLEAVEALLSANRIVSFHFGDLNEFGVPGAHDVPWGTGKGKTLQILDYLHKKQFKGYFSAEYEHKVEDNVSLIAQCVGFFNGVAGQLQM